MEKLNGKKVAILATNGFEQSELAEPRKALDEAGAVTHIVSLESGVIRGWSEKNWGDDFTVDALVSKVSADDYDALLLPGGVMNPDTLRTDEKAVSFRSSKTFLTPESQSPPFVTARNCSSKPMWWPDAD